MRESSGLRTSGGAVISNRIKSDAPTKKIVAALREVGASVEYFKAKRGKGNAGRPDLLVGFSGRNFLMEVKALDGKLSDEQKKFQDSWNGDRVHNVRSEAEALIAIGLVV